MKKSCAIGCAVLLLLAAALVGVVMTKAPHWWAKGKKFVSDTMAEEQRVSAFEAAWTPPSPEDVAGWAPQAVGEWKLELGAKKTDWPELKLDRAGWRSIYKQGARTIEIGAVPATELEKPELLKRLTSGAGPRLDDHAQEHRQWHGDAEFNTGQDDDDDGNRTHVQAGGEHLHGWLKDWLLFFRATDADPGASRRRPRRWRR